MRARGVVPILPTGRNAFSTGPSTDGRALRAFLRGGSTYRMRRMALALRLPWPLLAPPRGRRARALFVARVGRAMARARKGGPGFAVLVLAPNRFEAINAGLRNTGGERVLHDIARRLEGSLPPRGILACLGCAEFGILLEDVGAPAEATRCAE